MCRAAKSVQPTKILRGALVASFADEGATRDRVEREPELVVDLSMRRVQTPGGCVVHPDIASGRWLKQILTFG